MTKTPEQMAKEYAETVWDESELAPEDRAIERHVAIGKHSTKIGFLAGYQAAKDEYKEAIDTYNDVAKQMLQEAVRIMSPKDQLADADKVMINMEAFAEVLYADMPVAKEAFLRGYKQTKAKLNTIQPQWISVKERLPEINKGFIGFVENKEVCNCYRYPDSSSDGSPVFYAQSKLGLLIGGLESISHWQPLPKPPKEEK